MGNAVCLDKDNYQTLQLLPATFNELDTRDVEELVKEDWWGDYCISEDATVQYLLDVIEGRKGQNIDGALKWQLKVNYQRDQEFAGEILTKKIRELSWKLDRSDPKTQTVIHASAGLVGTGYFGLIGVLFGADVGSMFGAPGTIAGGAVGFYSGLYYGSKAIFSDPASEILYWAFGDGLAEGLYWSLGIGEFEPRYDFNYDSARWSYAEDADQLSYRYHFGVRSDEETVDAAEERCKGLSDQCIHVNWPAFEGHDKRVPFED